MKNPVLKKVVALAVGATLAVSIPVMAASGDDVAKDDTYTKTVTVQPDEDEEFKAYDTTVTVVVENGKIASISATDPADEDNQKYFDWAIKGKTRSSGTIPGLQEKLVGKDAKEGAADVDGVSGATCTSTAVKLAIADIIAEAPTDNELPIVPDDPTSEPVYVLMNVPYEDFYGVNGSISLDADAISSATNKVGNTTKAGGGYHSGVTAQLNEDGTYSAVGGENGAHMEGVTWPVKASSLDAVEELGGKEVTDDTTVTVATMGKGATSSNELTGAKALMEQPSYSYYVLDAEPANALTLAVVDGKAVFAASESPKTLESIDLDVSYGTHWGDVQLDFDTPEELNGKQLNALVITAEDGTKAGMVHLYNAWSNNSLGWEVAKVQGLDGKKLTNLRYYVNDTEGNYEVYDVPVDVDILPVYGGVIGAYFEDGALVLKGLPKKLENARAVVSITEGARGAQTTTYLTKTYIDPDDGDTEPEQVPVVDGTVELVNDPEEEKTYTVVVASDNYAPMSTTATLGVIPDVPEVPDEPDDTKPDDQAPDPDDSKSDEDDSKSDEDDSKSDEDDSKADEETLDGIVKGPDGKWALYVDGDVDVDYTGIAKNQYGWWRIVDGYVDFDANGIYRNEYGWWKTTDGKVTFDETGVFKNAYGWWRVVDSKVDFEADGIYRNDYGWWKTTGGKVTFKENGVYKNEYGWWKVKDSKVDFTFNGLAKNKYGTWYIKNGKVDFTKNGKVKYNNHIYTIKNGKVK